MTNKLSHNINAKGVALVQVLFLSALLAIIALHFTLTSRQQVNIAATMQDKVQAELQLITVQNELLFALLTSKSTIPLDPHSALAAFADDINFYGKPFNAAQQARVKIQDIEGLISVSVPGNRGDVLALLNELGADENDAVQLVAELEFMQGLPSSTYQSRPTRLQQTLMPLQSLSALPKLPAILPEFYQRLAALTTIHPNSRFNPLHAPDKVLLALLPQETANEAISARANNALTVARYNQLTTIENFEYFTFVRGPRLLVEIEVSHGAAVAKKRFICYIRPNNQFPLIWLD